MQYVTSPGELIRRLQALTSIDTESLYGIDGDNTALTSASWYWPDKKQAHEEYWGSVVRDFLMGYENRDIALEDLWTKTNIHEHLEGSRDGDIIKRPRAMPRHVIPWLYSRVTGSDARNRSYYGYRMNRRDTCWINDGKTKHGSFFDFVDDIPRMFFHAMEPYLEGVDLFVDLGSGWGRYSTALFLKHRHIRVLAGELSDAGRAATAIIADKYGLAIETLPFNYYAYENLIGRLGGERLNKIIIFTSHSVEQVTYLYKRMFDEILALPIPTIVFVHIEPLGWQIMGAENSPHLSRPPPRTPDGHGGYNKNLYLIVMKLLEEEKIGMDRITPYYFGNLAPKKTGSLLVYHKR